MICGSFNESGGRVMEIKDVDGAAFRQVLCAWCGKELEPRADVGVLLKLGSVADRFQMTEVVTALEEAIIRQLSVATCADVLSWCGGAWLERGEEAARKLAVERFEEVAGTGGFLRLSEETVGRLLEEDGLGVGTEEAAFEAAVRWMQAGDGGSWRGRGLLRAIRFPLMGWEYLEGRVREAVGGLDGEGIGSVVEEALRAKAAMRDGARADVRLLGPKATVGRVGRGVRWEDYLSMADGGGRRLRGHTGDVRAFAAWEGRICSGSEDGTVRIWNRASLEEERALRVEDGAPCGVRSLAVWEGRVVVGYSDGRLRVCSLATGECEQVLQGHTGAIQALAVQGTRLVSGSWDRTIRVWAMGAGAAWACERTLTGHTDWITCLATWRDKIISGSADATVRIWDAATGALDATLTGHGGQVLGLAVGGDRVFSASADGTIRSWAAGTWSLERTVRAYPEDGNEFPRCLVVSGGKLVSGSCGGAPCEVRGREPFVLSLRCVTAPI